MDKCKAFDVWLDKRLCEMEAIGLDEAFYAGWQSRQAEVEEKDKRIEELESALTQIKLWESHPKNHETNFGSWGLRDFYRDLAEKALRGEYE